MLQVLSRRVTTGSYEGDLGKTTNPGGRADETAKGAVPPLTAEALAA